MKKTPYEKWLDYALYLLSIRMRTKAEILKKLKEKQVEPEIIQLVLSFLESHHYIDDENFAQLYIENHQHEHGAYRMRRKLKEKGIEEAILEPLFEAIDEEDSLASAKQVLLKKCRSLSIDQEQLQSDYVYRQKIYQKLMRFLAYRGFSSSVTHTVIKDVLQQEFFDEF